MTARLNWPLIYLASMRILGTGQNQNVKSLSSKFWHKFREDVFQLNFYRLHMAYFITTIIIASVIVYGSGIADDPIEDSGGHLEYIDAQFLCTSAMTATGQCLSF